VAIVGVGQTGYRSHFEETYPELVFRAATITLKDAGISARDIDSVVLPMAPEALSGVGHAERWVTDAAAAVGLPFMRVNTGGVTGLTAVETAYWQVASGLADRVLIVGADRVGESGEAQQILNRIWEPIYERQLPLNTITMLAFQGVRFMQRYGIDERDMARVAVKNRSNGALNPHAHLRAPVTMEEVLKSRVIAWPIKLLDSCPQSSGGAGLVLAAGEAIPNGEGRPVWISGVGHDTETYWMGDRMGPRALSDHADASALARAAAKAYRWAGITDPRTELDLAELYAPFSNTELHAIQDVGLSPSGEVAAHLLAGEYALGGPLPVNPSGGVMCANPIAVTALVRVAEAALQVQGRAGAHQVAGAKTALATGVGGDHQFFGAIVVSADRRGLAS
jgi:acetyl-CoA C-acetyltransferase